MGLYHSVYRAYGFEIPTTTDFERLDAVLADQPDGERLGRVQHLYLGDFERLFLLAVCNQVGPADFARVTADDYQRYELPVWNTVLHDMAVRLGQAAHPEPAWLLLHDLS
ncbi:hypothetical protein KBZ00_25840 [Streptomyces sp. RK31]|uniref:hypothetical protein n=1 Tax=Streptomyces sp. RK31 TaxID=2824892 RepID=UPI001B37C114|nr:hypothetical protein [Streptomyces sp. RK31]MBQ0974522.1 hypothetical protein [Streptomyces sp. RK31]